MEYVENSNSRANVLQCLRKEERKAELKGATKEKDSPSPTPSSSRAIEQVKPRLLISLSTICKSLVNSQVLI